METQRRSEWNDLKILLSRGKDCLGSDRLLFSCSPPGRMRRVGDLDFYCRPHIRGKLNKWRRHWKDTLSVSFTFNWSANFRSFQILFCFVSARSFAKKLRDSYQMTHCGDQKYSCPTWFSTVDQMWMSNIPKAQLLLLLFLFCCNPFNSITDMIRLKPLLNHSIV